MPTIEVMVGKGRIIILAHTGYSLNGCSSAEPFSASPDEGKLGGFSKKLTKY